MEKLGKNIFEIMCSILLVHTGTNYGVQTQRNFNGQDTAVYDKVIRANDPNYTG